ncbi:MAG: membrane protein [Hyphococcus sp.]|nr:MAG: membrane protein [Marinicaulis sp.]
MSLQPLLEAPWIIQVHAFGAMAAFLLGVIQFAAPKGTLPHKSLGVVWILLMTSIAVSSIFIRPAFYPGLPMTQWFGPIHLLTLLTFWGIAQGAYFLIKGGPTLKAHKGPFIGIFIGGLVIAGGLAFLPGRIMHAVAFGA